MPGILNWSKVTLASSICSWYIHSNGTTSTGERPFIDILQDRRYWGIHGVAIPALFVTGIAFIYTGFAYGLFGTPNWDSYFYSGPANISRNMINDRFSISVFLDDF